MERKYSSPGRRSSPDRILFPPFREKVVFIEFKKPGEKPTEAQMLEISRLKARGQEVHVIDNIPAGKQLIKEIFVDALFPVTSASCHGSFPIRERHRHALRRDGHR